MVSQSDTPHSACLGGKYRLKNKQICTELGQIFPRSLFQTVSNIKADQEIEVSDGLEHFKQVHSIPQIKMLSAGIIHTL